MQATTAPGFFCCIACPAAAISDQVFAASEKFHKARIAYEVERDALRELEQQLILLTYLQQLLD